MALRKKFGITVLAIRHDQQTLSSPDGDTKLQTDDVLVVLRSPAQIGGIATLFHISGEGDPPG